MRINDFIENAGIASRGKMSDDGVYVINLSDSNEYSKMYTVLDKMDGIYLDASNIMVDEHASILTYTGEGIKAELKADFDANLYTLNIWEE